LDILKELRTETGKLFHIQIGTVSLELKFTNHAKERIERWGLTEQQALETLLYPQEVLRGHHGRFIAHRRYGDHIVRAVYEYEGGVPLLVTVYFPYANRYYQGGKQHEDKILF
jgi:hypothetical protein